MPDDSLIQPDYAQMGYYSEDDAVAAVDNCGTVTAVSEGETVVHAYLTKADGTVLDSSTVVVVEGTRTPVTVSPDNLITD
jgi:hypothetical protein